MLSGGGCEEGEYMRSIAIKNGVPEKALLLDTISFETFENARETARLLAPIDLRSVLLVSDRTHLPRAWLLGRFIGLEIAGCAVNRATGECSELSSRPEDSHLRALPDPYVNLAIHTAPDVRPFP